MKKIISVVVILLFIGLAFVPSINNANISAGNVDNLFIDFIGLNNEKTYEHTLSSSQINEIYKMLDTQVKYLKNVSNIQESFYIIMDTIKNLESYGLIENKDVKYFYNGFQKEDNLSRLEKSINSNPTNFPIKNLFCFLIVNNTSEDSNHEIGIASIGFFFFFITAMALIYFNDNWELAFWLTIPTLLFGLIGVPAFFYNIFSPLKFWVIVVMNTHSESWSLGLFGFRYIKNIEYLIGFKGIRIRALDKTKYYIGHALALFNLSEIE